MNIKPILILLAFALTSSLVQAADKKTGAASGGNDKPVAKVNGVNIAPILANIMLSEQLSQGLKNDDALRTAIIEELIKREVIAQEAKKRGYEKNAEVTARIDIARQGVLIGAYIQDFVSKNPVQDAQVRAEYDRRLAATPGTEYKVSHIQFEKMEEAQAAISKLQSGAKFSDLAKESVDLGSKDQGGDIGWIAPGTGPVSFTEAVQKLEKGTFTTIPVQTPYGFHVIFLDNTRKATPPTYEAKKNELRQNLEQILLDEHINSLVKKAKVE